jgi:hypothetical protein
MEDKIGKNGRRISAKSLANLRPQVKGGVARNPHGRPKNRLCLTAIAREKLGEKRPDDPKGRTQGEYLVDQWIEKAAENPVYFRELLERMEGKVTQPISGEGGGAVIFKILVANEHDKESVERVMKGERT